MTAVTLTARTCARCTDMDQHVISVGVGQCGTRIVHSLLDSLYQQHIPAIEAPADRAAATSSFFRAPNTSSEDSAAAPPAVARAVLVDTESKAIDQCVRGAAPWRYAQQNAHAVAQGGAGNNWARGYCRYGDAEGVMNSVRREAEACDYLGHYRNSFR